MSSESLGPQVLRTAKFLQQIYNDLAVLVQHADMVFDENKWSVTDKTKVFSRLSNRLNPKGWLLTRLYRFYTPRAAGGSVDRVIALIPILDPQKAYDEPICTAWTVTLSRPIKPQTIAKHRKRFRTLVDSLEGQVGGYELPSRLMGSCFPQATHVRAVVVPLCNLAGERDLIDQLIMPILNPPSPPIDNRPAQGPHNQEAI